MVVLHLILYIAVKKDVSGFMKSIGEREVGESKVGREPLELNKK